MFAIIRARVRRGEHTHPGVEVRHGRGDGEEAAGAVGERVLPQEAVQLELQQTVQAGQVRAPQAPILVQHANQSVLTNTIAITIRDGRGCESVSSTDTMRRQQYTRGRREERLDHLAVGAQELERESPQQPARLALLRACKRRPKHMRRDQNELDLRPYDYEVRRGAHLVGEHLNHLLEACVHAHQVVQVLRVAVEQVSELDQHLQLLRLLLLRTRLRLPRVAQMPMRRQTCRSSSTVESSKLLSNCSRIALRILSLSKQAGLEMSN